MNKILSIFYNIYYFIYLKVSHFVNTQPVNSWEQAIAISKNYLNGFINLSFDNLEKHYNFFPYHNAEKKEWVVACSLKTEDGYCTNGGIGLIIGENNGRIIECKLYK